MNTHCADKIVHPVNSCIGNKRNTFTLHEYSLQKEVLVVYIFYIVSVCSHAHTPARGTNKQNILNILYLSYLFLKFVVPECLNFIGEFNVNNDTFLGTVSLYVIRRERFRKGLHYRWNIPNFQKELRRNQYVYISHTSWLRRRNNPLQIYFEVMEVLSYSFDYFSECG